MNAALPTLTLEPIGFIRTPYADRASAPRQPYASGEVEGTIELLPRRGFEHALDDLDEWRFIWVIFWFHLNRGWRPKVLPPRSAVRRGLFATRTPHRPNPLGISVLRLVSVEGLTIRVRGVDLIDGTPILDIKPYVPWADSIPDAGTGWFDAPPTLDASSQPRPGALDAKVQQRPSDPIDEYQVHFDAHAEAQLTWLRERHQIDLVPSLRRALALGPHPHPYRRIKPATDMPDTFVVAYKEWRARFRIEPESPRTLTVFAVFTGYRPDALAGPDPALDTHREFVATWSMHDATR